ncbi:phage tail sheath family protein [Actinomadura fibrosa]|uniref:Phage tail sheath family protein n=1 Tax=Actinomadura fibrosa TaxID=111802 RepID=A0ABW2XWM4_9ACTN|nr:phage tail sheath subtilisin-like domain-containing protein [Actinomadura fibrosa]
MAYDTAAPGVYVKEITPAGPIAGVGSTVTAFVGTPAVLPGEAGLGEPFPVTTWTAYVAKFGDYKAGVQLPYAVKGFFDNGGTFAYIVPVQNAAGLDAAIDRLTRYPDVSMVCLPGTVDAAAQAKVLAHCETMGDRFAVLDGVQDANPVNPQGPLLTQRGGLDSGNGFGALYWPWLVIPDPGAPDRRLTVPPSGHVAGIMARCDDTVGVHRAPANEDVRGALDVEYQLNDTEQGQLNHRNINAIRRFPGGPPLVWGARTLTTSVSWQYVNVRRLVCYVEDSIRQGVRWAVFAPNDLRLWRGLERSIGEFLTRVWQAGALFGATAKDAFYVSITEELNPPDVRARGEVVIEIGLAPSRPAEFIELRIGLWDGGASISEG